MKILNDSLTSTEVIRTYVDIEIYESKLRKFNEKFAKNERNSISINARLWLTARLRVIIF